MSNSSPLVKIKGRDLAEAAKDEPASGVVRTPWSGNMDEAELVKPGGLLIAALINCASERGQQLQDMAREIGVTYGYINQLRNGIRHVNLVSDDFSLGCARYLGVPRLTVLLLAGRVTPSDLFESEEMKASEISRAMLFICEDPTWGPLITPELREASLESKYAVVRLYEKATGKELMSNHLNVNTLGVEIQRLLQVQAQRLNQLKDLSAGTD